MQENSIWRLYTDKFTMADICRQIQYVGYIQTNSIWRIYEDKFNMVDMCRKVKHRGKSGQPRSISCYLKKRFDFSVKSPPLPVPEFEVRGTVPLQDSDSVQLLNFLLIVPEHQRNL